MTQSLLKQSQVENLSTSLDAKQDILVSGTSIKTVNGNSLLGSGDISISSGSGGGSITLPISIGDVATLQTALDSKHPTLVSGTNIKTINGVSLLTSGDITLSLKSLTDFGAIGDNNLASVPVNNAAISAALSYIASTGNNVRVGPGIYKCDPFVINNLGYANQGIFIGEDRERCVLSRATAGAGAFITVGAPTNTSFQSGLGFEGLQIDGGANTNGPAFVAYDLVKSRFESCFFKGGDVACSLLGGISLTFANCLFENAKIGLKINKYTSSAGGGWPNLITIDGGEIGGNSELGIWFDGGRQLLLRNVDVEGNGTTTGGALQGGMWCGPNLGQELIAGIYFTPYSLAVIVENCWFEANKGAADIYLGSGVNSVSDTSFFSGDTTRCLWIDAGQYIVKNMTCVLSKAQNLYEGASTLTGNIILGGRIPANVYTASKTSFSSGDRMFMNSAEVVTATGAAKPLIQAGGSATAGGSGAATITFPRSYGSTPSVILTPLDGGSTGRAYSLKLTSVGPSSFSVEGAITASTGGAPVLAAMGFTWMAIGQG